MNPRDASELGAFLEHLGRARRRALLLDYDGTLAPFRVERSQAVPYPGVREALSRIRDAGTTRVAIVSGRAASDLLPLIGLEPPVEIWGSHGWERRMADGADRSPPLPPSTAAALQQAQAALRAAAPEVAGLADRLERKPAGLALHWRGLDPAQAAAWEAAAREAWSELAAGEAWVLAPFRGGLELRAGGRTKGDAVRAVLDEVGAGAAVAYLGDDATDEDAFRALGAGHLGVLVASSPRPTAARLRLRPPEEVLEFIAGWSRAEAGGG